MRLDPKWDQRFLAMARLVSTWSKDPSTKCGAVIVDPDRHVVATGYNGFPAQMNDDPEVYNNRKSKYSRIIHCEMNALMRARQSVEGCTLYTWPMLSCDRCMVHMIQAGIARFVTVEVTGTRNERWAENLARSQSYALEAGCVVSTYPS